MSIALEDSTTVVALRGVGDLATLPAFIDTLACVIADRGGSVVVDLLRTEYLDTNRVRVIGRTDSFSTTGDGTSRFVRRLARRSWC